MSEIPQLILDGDGDDGDGSYIICPLCEGLCILLDTEIEPYKRADGTFGNQLAEVYECEQCGNSLIIETIID